MKTPKPIFNISFSIESGCEVVSAGLTDLNYLQLLLYTDINTGYLQYEARSD